MISCNSNKLTILLVSHPHDILYLHVLSTVGDPEELPDSPPTITVWPREFSDLELRLVSIWLCHM